MLGLQDRSPVGGTQEATTHWCFSLSLSPSLPRSKKKIKSYKEKKKCIQGFQKSHLQFSEKSIDHRICCSGISEKGLVFVPPLLVFQVLRLWPPFPSLGAFIFPVPLSLAVWLPCPGRGLSCTEFGSLAGLGQWDQFRLTSSGSVSQVRRKIPPGLEGQWDPWPCSQQPHFLISLVPVLSFCYLPQAKSLFSGPFMYFLWILNLCYVNS